MIPFQRSRNNKEYSSEIPASDVLASFWTVKWNIFILTLPFSSFFSTPTLLYPWPETQFHLKGCDGSGWAMKPKIKKRFKDYSVLTLLSINLRGPQGYLWSFMLTLDPHVQLGQCIKNNHLPFGISKQASTLVASASIFCCSVKDNVIEESNSFPNKPSSLLSVVVILKKETPLLYE